MPRLRQKTDPKEMGNSTEVDFEEEVAKYKRDIQKDIEAYKKQEYIAPKWKEEAMGPQPQPESTETGGDSSSS